MDGERFDVLTKLFVTRATRRGVLGGLFGGAAALVGAALGQNPTLAAPKPKTCKVGCSGFNRQAKTACERACKECGGDFNRVCTEDGPFGPVSFTCCPTGTFCVFGAGLCCTEGTEPCFGPDGSASCCEEGTFCDFETGQCGPPAICDANSGCLGGTCATGCFCVTDTEGQGACVNAEFANCGAQPCETSADCGEGGHCVDASADECCATPTRICFPAEAICRTGGTGGAAGQRTAPGWTG